jgi:hypothetical protein
MNKYQEALNRIAKYCGVNNGSMLEDDLKTLQELVDKATPKKPIEEIDSYDDFDYSVDYCPNCKNEVDDTYCPACGQKIDWSE